MRWRFRMKGRPACYINHEYGSKAFEAAYKAAVESSFDITSPTLDEGRGTFGWLIEEYARRPAWSKLAKITRTNQWNDFQRFRQEYGTAMVRDLRSDHVEKMLAKKASTPSAANHLLRTVKLLCRFAVKIRLIEADPTASVERYAENPDGFHTWTTLEIGQFIEFHGAASKPALALELMLSTGAARQDVIALGWQNIRAGRIAYRRHKTGGEVDLNLSLMPDLSTLLEDLPRDRMLFLSWGAGRPYTAAGFGNRFREWCSKAGLPHCSAHGLRKAGATRLAEAGATEFEIMSFLGHRTTDEARTYVKRANRAKMADAGMRKLLGVSNQVVGLDKHRSKLLK
ncbi:tyrosine-type recombinase/integrase [Aureimonas sp. AU20]|uniref:tyrosine-type recombinase/integrase n=1 Tax=Aureimonas sp. AU20 TaxID=1349819 RepID=UPI00078421E5|nr:tyrosine-type recombinase/integrase [Aureimonas sp. AU20]